LKLIDGNFQKPYKILSWLKTNRHNIKNVQKNDLVNQLPTQLLQETGFINYNRISCCENALRQVIFNSQ